jgi:hypothetical protein
VSARRTRASSPPLSAVSGNSTRGAELPQRTLRNTGLRAADRSHA